MEMLGGRRAVAVGLLLAAASIAAEPVPQPRWSELMHLPLSMVIDVGTRWDPTAVAAHPAELRRLFWLAELARWWGREGLHSFFVLSGADVAPEIGQALSEAGLDRRAAVFARALALCGTPFPRDRAAREARFGRSRPGQGGNASDRALLALGAEFGSLDDYWRSVEGVVERSPALTAWAAAQRAATPDSDRLDWLMDQLFVAGPDETGRIMRDWPRPYQLLYLLELFNGETRNGGVAQFFFNASGSLAPDVVAALREAGLPHHADAVQRGIDLFRSPYPRDTGQRRAEYFHPDGTTPFDAALNGLLDDVEDSSTIEAATAALARREDVVPR